MLISSILSPGAVKVLAATSSKKRLLHDVGDLAASACHVNGAQAIEALLDRESLGPTGVGHGVALPHARLSDIEAVSGVFILLQKPVDFDAVDRQPVDLIFALFAPEAAGVEHLKALAAVSRTLRDSAVRAKLRANPEPQTLYTILTAAESASVA